MNKQTYIVSGIISLIVALVVGLGLGARSSPTPVSNDLQAGAISGPVQNVPWNFTQGAGLGGKYVNFSQSLKIFPSTNFAVWTNKTGRTVYVVRTDASLVPATGTSTVTASSTYALYAYASSSPIASATATSTRYDFTAPTETGNLFQNFTRFLINNFTIATSTTATTTSSLDKAGSGKVVQVPDGASVSYLLSSPGPVCTNVGTTCTTATSTGRGFDVDIKLDGYYAP